MTMVITYLLLFFQFFSPKVSACTSDLIVSVATQKLSLDVVISDKQKSQGLSGKKKLGNGRGMFFYYPQTTKLAFWMPDTYFNLDIYFLNEKLTVTAIERNMKSHPGLKEPPVIQRTKQYLAKYVLELKSNDPSGKKIKLGSSLKFICSTYFQQIKQGIRLLK